MMRRVRSIRAFVALVVALAWLAGVGLAVAQDQKPVEKVKDVVCGMKIDPAKAKGKSEYKGKTYHFCSEDCKTKFDKDPAKYAEKTEPAK